MKQSAVAMVEKEDWDNPTLSIVSHPEGADREEILEIFGNEQGLIDEDEPESREWFFDGEEDGDICIVIKAIN